MQGKYNSSAIVLSLLIVGAIGTIVYFLLKKKKVDNDDAAATKSGTTNQSVANKIVAGYDKSLSVLSASEISKYSGWLDTAESLAKNYLTQKGSNPQIDFNLNSVTNFPDNNFRSVVQKWKSVRGITDLRDTNLLKALGNLVDPTYDAVNDFYAKAVQLKIS